MRRITATKKRTTQTSTKVSPVASCRKQSIQGTRFTRTSRRIRRSRSKSVLTVRVCELQLGSYFKRRVLEDSKRKSSENRGESHTLMHEGVGHRRSPAQSFTARKSSGKPYRIPHSQAAEGARGPRRLTAPCEAPAAAAPDRGGDAASPPSPPAPGRGARSRPRTAREGGEERRGSPAATPRPTAAAPVSLPEGRYPARRGPTASPGGPLREWARNAAPPYLPPPRDPGGRRPYPPVPRRRHRLRAPSSSGG